MRRSDLLLTVLLFPGCLIGFDTPDAEPEPQPEWEEEEAPADRIAPEILSVSSPAGAILGPDDPIEIRARDDRALDRAEVTFSDTFRVDLDDSETTAAFTVWGSELGEGYGTLRAAVWDEAQNSEVAGIEQVLVDLTPPEIVLGATTLGREGQLEFVVQDAWILRAVTVVVDDVAIRRDFETARAGLGETWDQSLVTIDSAELPSGSREATITVHDAAGNWTREIVPIIVDTHPPVVTLAAVTEGPHAAPFDVTVTANDDFDTAPTTTLLLSGTPVGEVRGAASLITVDPLEFAAGEHVLQAVSVDAAGNSGWSRAIPIVLR